MTELAQFCIIRVQRLDSGGELSNQVQGNRFSSCEASIHSAEKTKQYLKGRLEEDPTSGGSRHSDEGPA